MYTYINPNDIVDPHKLPDLDVWYDDAWLVCCGTCGVSTIPKTACLSGDTAVCPMCEQPRTVIRTTGEGGWWYAYGTLDTMHTSPAFGPFASIGEAVDEARALADQGEES